MIIIMIAHYYDYDLHNMMLYKYKKKFFTMVFLTFI